MVRGPGAAGEPKAAKVETDALLILVQVAVAEEDDPKPLALTRERLALSKKRVGDRHPEVASVRENLGNVCFREGQLDKTGKNLEVVLAKRRKALGDDSEPGARTLANIGTVYKRAGNDEAAVKNYREAVERL